MTRTRKIDPRTARPAAGLGARLPPIRPRLLPIRLFASLLGACSALALCPVPAPAGETTETAGAPMPTSSSTTTTASPPTGPSPSPPNTPTVTSEATSTAPAPEPTVPAPEPTAPAPTIPQVQAQAPQAPSGPVRRHAKGHPAPAAGGTSPASANSTTANNVHAPAPSALTPPPLPSALGSPLAGGVPDFFIANFPMPPFLLPIYQAAGRAYGIPWRVLAAINEVETDYGRDLSISSAGAEGWMQFLPSSWAQYGVDANGDGYADPYNPADAIFAAARYLRAAGGRHNIREAIFAYNHSQSYVASVLLRAQLLRGTPPQLLSAIADLAEARFPVHAPAHFSDGFPALPGHPGRPLVATAIYSIPGAPVIAVQDGTILAIGRSAKLGRYVRLLDAYGDTYTYGDLGSVATLYPVLTPRAPAARHGHISEIGSAQASVGQSRQGMERRGAVSSSIPASAGVQPRSPLSAGAVSSGLSMGAAAVLETTPAPPAPTPLLRSRAHHTHASHGTPRVFRAGHEIVHLRPLQVGSHVIAGTVIGHLGAATSEEASTTTPPVTPPAANVGSAGATPVPATGPQARMIFQIRPNGVGAPLIDPKPILDGWVQLQGSLIYRAIGQHRFPAAPSAAPHSKLLPQNAVRLANVLAPTLTPGQWLRLMTRLGSIPDPVVAGGHSAASLPIANGKGNGNGNGNH
jgi:soluble lytic murein transglycosylase-like protein